MSKIVLNEDIDFVYNDVDIKEVEKEFDKGCSILYVVDKDRHYLGCITRRELFLSLKQNCLVANYDSYKLQHGDSEKERAKELFDIQRNIYNVPVVDDKGVLLYEYIHELSDETFDSIKYWENRYKEGGNSGEGSYNKLAEFKAEIINKFIEENNVNSVIEWGFGDGNQLSLLKVPSYIGYDVSETACKMCKERFRNDRSKEFRHYDGSPIMNCQGIYDMAISLDVLYHLVEDDKFDDYLYNLFNSSNKYVCIYSSDYEERQRAHVKRRKFTEYVKKTFLEWEIIAVVKNPWLHEASNSNFYFYKKIFNWVL